MHDAIARRYLWDRTIDFSESSGLRTFGSQSTGVEGRTILYIGFKFLEQTIAFFTAFTKDMGGGADFGGAWWHTDHHKEAAPPPAVIAERFRSAIV